MKIQVGDLFIIKGITVSDFSFIITEDCGSNYQVTMYYPEGNIKKQALEYHMILHFVRKKEFIHYPVVK